jgi:ribosomal protein L17
VERDRVIFQAVIKRLQKHGDEIRLVSEDSLSAPESSGYPDYPGTPDLILTMARRPETLTWLDSFGIACINSPEGIGRCSRSRLQDIMQHIGIPVPPKEGADGYWLKRGDSAAQTAEDVVYVPDREQLAAAIQTMRQRQMVPTWQLDMAEADYCYATMDYTKALQLYQSVYRSGEAKGVPEIYLALLARLMQTHDILYNEDELVTYIYELRQEAQRRKNDAYMAMADFTLGKRKHYHRKKEEGLELCIKAIDTMKGSDYFRKDNELCDYYASLLQMYMNDGRYDDALRMSLLQEEAVLRIKGVNVNNKETLRYVYALRASLLAKAGRTEEANLTYDKWKKQPGGNCIVDKPILDYLIIYKHYQEAHDLIHDYHDMLKNQKDNYSYRMITLLTTAAQVEGALGNIDEANKHCQEIKTIADSLHISKSNSLMETSWNLIQTKEDVVKKLFDTVAPEYADKNGGYVQIYKLGPRRGDGAEMALIRLVETEEKKDEKAKKNTKKTTKKAAPKAKPAKEEPKEEPAEAPAKEADEPAKEEAAE